MTMPVLATKLYKPPPRPNIVLRPRLMACLDEGLTAHRKLTLISAPAGFGKTTLLSKWVATIGLPVAWLSLEQAESDPIRFLTYLTAALQTLQPNLGAGVLRVLQEPQPPSLEVILTKLVNEIADLPDNFILILDDYHVIEPKLVEASSSVDEALTFLIDHLPPQMHLVIATRENPPLPLARYRARGQLTELRAAELRFTHAETAEFLNQAMNLRLSEEDINTLEARTEGWIAGLHLAALAMQGAPSTRGNQNATEFIQAFAGSHHFVLDYLVEEVLHQQPEGVQTFLLGTSILDRLCGPLCDAVLHGEADALSPSGQETLEYLEGANIFIVPLDDERRWYRYHHLFAELLRQRLQQIGKASPGEATLSIPDLHIRASQWYEDNDLVFEAFRHATVANDIARAERLIGSDAMPLHFHSVAMAIVDWLVSLPKTVLDARPWLWVTSCTLALMAGQTSGVEERLQAAEEALQNFEPVLSNIEGPVPGAAEGINDKIRDQIGRIACARATLALTRYEPETMLIQARRALAYLHPDNLVFRFTANWALTSASLLQGDRVTAAQACQEALLLSQKSGDIFSTVLALSDLGQIQELENQLHQAAETYRRLLPLFGEHPHPNAAEVYLGLARIYYEWNDLEAAEKYGQRSLQLAHQYDRVIDRFIISEVFLACLKLAQDDVEGAAVLLTQTEQTARQKNFLQRMPEIAAVQVQVLLRQGKLAGAAHLSRQYELPLSQVRVHLAQGNPSAALAILKPFRREMEARSWADDQLKAIVLQALAHHQNDEKDKALQLLGEALTLAEAGGFIRIFVDEGAQMAGLISEVAAQGIWPDYTARLLAVFEAEGLVSDQDSAFSSEQTLIESLSPRELEVLQLIAQGLSNREISERLFLALSTVKGHNRVIFDKLQVRRRTEAVARARELGLL